MTKEELREHCEKQVKACEMVAENRGQEPSGKVYEEHKLILELLEENEDFQKYIDKANHTNSQLIQLIEKHKINRDTSDDCVSRQAVVEWLEHATDDSIEHAIDSNLEFLPPVTPTQRWIPVSERLPNEGKEVLAYYEYFRYGDYNCMQTTYGVGYQYDGLWCGDVRGHKLNVIAWQPLPKLYEEKRGNENGSN